MVIDYHHNFYRGDNILVVAAGNLNHNHLLDYVNKYFGKL
jgi:predicted Zn-dependent peptidase